MRRSLKSRMRYAFNVAIAFTPWLLAMYLFYWLDSSGTWTSETPHRGKISVALLAAGMGSSLFVHSYLAKRQQK